MSSVRQRPRLDFSGHGQGKNFVDFDPGSPNVGNLSPDLQTICSAPEFKPQHTNVCQIGKYFLLDHVEETNTYTAINKENGESFVCKVFPIEKYRECLSAFWRADGNEHVSHISEIILGESKAYVIFDGNHGDLHGHVRQKKRLREDEASRLFQQIVTAVAHCHDNGIVLRDLKLRKFVFKDADKKHLRLEGLEDAYVCSSVADDRLTDKHGCPAYVSPEILNATQSYSGRAADIWSLGVMLYTMLIGRYPFHDTEPSALFTKIRRGQFTVPDILSTRAKCLIKSLLRRDPDERLTAHQILQHPWLKSRHRSAFSQRVNNPKNSDQTVPDTVFPNSDCEFYV